MDKVWKECENSVQASLDYYEREGVAYGSKTYPEVTVVAKRIIFTGHGSVDFHCVCQGRAIWFDVKSVYAVDTVLLSGRLHQLEQMRKAQDIGGAVCGYLARWYKSSKSGFINEWRWHWIKNAREEYRINRKKNALCIRINREEGELVQYLDNFQPVDNEYSIGWPDFIRVTQSETSPTKPQGK